MRGEERGIPGPARRLELFNRLRECVEGSREGVDVSHKLGDVTVVIRAGSGSGNVDSAGRIELAADDSAEEWLRALQAFDMAEVMHVHSGAVELDELESRVAAALGVKLVFTDAAHPQTAFRDLLARLESGEGSAARQRPRMHDAIAEGDDPLAVLLTADSEASFEIVPEKCLLRCPLDASLDEIFDFVAKQSAGAVLGYRKHIKSLRESDKVCFVYARKRLLFPFLSSHDYSLPVGSRYQKNFPNSQNRR